MNKAVKYLKDSRTFYLATVEDGQPRVRPFGAVTEFNGKVYISTNNTKDCFKQMMKNPKVEITAVNGGSWIRVRGEIYVDKDTEARKAVFEDNPSLSSMYALDDGIFEVLYLKNATATFYSFTSEPEIISL